MNLIQEITNEAKQKHTLILPSGNTMILNLEFKPQQIGWFMSIVYQDFEVDNIRVVTSPNIFHQFKNLVPFGIACFTNDNHEPLLQQDFSSGRAKLFILTLDDVAQFEAILSGG